MKRCATRRTRTDEGSALILVLVLMVVGSLIILPLMDFAMSVGRANTVLSVKTERTEAVKAGLRITMAEPTRIYDACGDTAEVPLSVTGLKIDVLATCRLLSSGKALDDTQKRIGLAAVQVGETVPAVLLANVTPDPPDAGYVPPVPPYTPPTTPENAWQADATTTSVTDKLWLPNLSGHAQSLRSPLGWSMPTGFPACTVYFPGTYPSEVILTGPTFFTSGVYYFENNVSVQNGADVVVGQGLLKGCTTDQLAAYYAVDGPTTHNISGAGATFVFGKLGRLVVSNNASTAPIKLRFNQRYVGGSDPVNTPSAGVSIVSVNGALEPDGVTGKRLEIPGKLDVPLSLVGADPVAPAVGPLPAAATTQKYIPSTLVPAMPTVPDPPTSVTAVANKAAARISWTAPVNAGHSQIIAYTVRVSSGTASTEVCQTVSTTSCAVTNLTNGSPYRFTVEATNAIGTSIPSAESSPSVTTPTDSSPDPTTNVPGPLVDLPPEPSTPIVDLDLVSAAAPVQIYVPGHVSTPQGRIRISNAHNLDVTFDGGVLAASFDVVDLRPAPVPIGLVNAVTQRTIQIVTQTTPASGSPRVASSAILQINQNGAWAINSWEVQGP